MSKKFLFLLIFHFLPFQSEYLSAQNSDIDLLHELNSGGSVARDNVSLFFTRSVTPVIVGVPVGVFIYGVAKHDSITKRNSYIIAASLITSTIISTGMKYGFNRDRPFVTYPFITKKTYAGSPSFPSGHTSYAFSTATSLSLVYPKWYVITPSFLWACSVGYSRMELGVHYPSDVLVGAVVGVGSAWLAWETNKYLARRKK